MRGPEALRAALSVSQARPSSLGMEPGDVLAEAYNEVNLPEAKRQFVKAASWLAWVLTDTLKPK